MNTFRQDRPGEWRPRSRGFYTEGIEDHVTPVLFQNWALFPDYRWVAAFLRSFGIDPKGEVRRARWCTSFEEIYNNKKFGIADIAFAWGDDDGLGVLVIEAKVQGGKLAAKDHPAHAPYLKMPAIKVIPRRYFGFLVDERDKAKVQRQIEMTAPIVTWQDLVSLQIEAAENLPLRSRIVERTTSTIATHFSYFGIGCKGRKVASFEEAESATGTESRYQAIRALQLPASLQQFLLGSEVVFAARQGIMPKPPYSWLQEEPSCLEVYLNGKAHAPGYQRRPDRCALRWHPEWRP